MTAPTQSRPTPRGSADRPRTVADLAERRSERRETAFPSPTPRRRLIVATAFFTIVVEALGTADLVPSVRIGALDLQLSVIPALALAVACGSRLIGRSSSRINAVVYWTCAAVVLPSLALVYARTDRMDLWLSLVVAAFGEELIYRLAIPMVAAALLRYFGVRAAVARPVGFAIAALWFVALPGHREQMQTAAGALPFLAFAALAAIVVYRSGSVLPMAAAHAVTNLLTVLLWTASTSADQRSMGLLVVLGLLVVAYGRPRRLTVGDDGELVDTRTGLDVASVDLRDGHPPTAVLVDGTVIEVDRPPAHTGEVPVITDCA